MADRLTQLQDCYDDLATQMFASLRYIQTRHAYGVIEGQPDMNPHAAAATSAGTGANGAANGDNQAQNGQQNDAGASPDEHVPDPPDVFQAALRELARDLVMKEQQIEYLISILPGIGNSETDQSARIQALEAELRQADREQSTAMQDREQMLDLLSHLAAHCKRVY